MELKNLNTFIQVVESGSFSKAADKMGYTQSTVSFQIKQLEDELGCKIFDRIGKQVDLTMMGHKLLKHAKLIKNDVTDMIDDFNNEPDQIQGEVHMFSVDSICERMMMLNYQDFYSKYPGIKLVFSTGDTVDMIRLLDHNEVDVIFTLDEHIYQSAYVITKESPVRLFFVARTGHPLAVRKDLDIHDLIKYPFLMTEKGKSYRKVLDNKLGEMNLEIEPVLETGRTDIIVQCLKGGDSIGFLPDFVVEDHIKRGELVSLEVKDIQLSIWKQLIYHKDKWISRPLDIFLEYVKAHEFKW